MNDLVTGTTDPFGAALTQLQDTLQSFGPLVGPIEDADKFITEIDDLLKAVSELITAATDIDDIFEVLGAVLNFLDPIPFVGEVAAIFAEGIEAVADAFAEPLQVLQTDVQPIIKDLITVLTDIQKGLEDIRDVVVELSQQIPGYINTVEILHYLSEIAEPIAEVLEGTEASDKLTQLLSTFNTIQDDLGTALGTLDPLLKAVQTGVTDFANAITTIENAMGSAAGTVLSDLEDAAKFLQPISDTFHRIEDAVKPIAWVLDAVKCIIDKILKPVIDAILDATGLKSLVNEAEASLFNKLGLGEITSSAQGNLKSDGFSSSQGAMGSKSGSNSSAAWLDVGKSLAQYRAGGSDGTRAAILSLVGAITGTPIDPNKPAVPPGFPPRKPDLNPAQPASQTALVSRMAVARRKQVDWSSLDRIAKPVPRQHTRSLAVMLTHYPEHRRIFAAVSPLATPVDPTVWPNTASMIANAGKETGTLDALCTAAATLETSLQGLADSLTLPADFDRQTGDLQRLLDDSVKILDFFESLKIDWVTSLVDPFDTVAHDQQTKCAAVVSATSALTTAVADLEKHSAAVVAAMPKSTVIDQALHRVEGWSIGATQLVQAVELARSQDQAKGGSQKQAIDDLATDIEDAAKAVNGYLGNVSTQAQTLTTSIAALSQALDSYASVLKPVSQHSTLLSGKALPVAEEAIRILDLVDSVVDPLSGLLTATGCVDGSSPLKVYGAGALDTINGLGKAAATAAPDSFTQFAEGLAESVLPLTTMASDTNTAATTISGEVVSAFDANADAVTKALAALTKALEYNTNYTATIQPRPGYHGQDNPSPIQVQVDNDLFTEAMLQKANAILAALGGKS